MKTPLDINVTQGLLLAGKFRLQVSRDNVLVEDTGWFDNLITDQGLDWIGGNNPKYNTSFGGNYLNTHCGVGTGTTPPSFTDTLLTTPLAMYPAAASSNVEGGTVTYVAGINPYWSCVWTYSFAVGAVVGNLTEVGVGCTDVGNTTPQLFNHALILDGGGSPTTLPVTSADALTVTYELRYYIDTTDNTYSMLVSGISYGGTYRRMGITSAPLIYFPVFGSFNGSAIGNVGCLAYSGFALGPITGNPSFTSSDGNTAFTYTITAYVANSYYCEFTTFMPLARANFTGGITGFSTNCNHGQYQFSISPNIPKDATYTLSITWRVSWARYP